MTGAAIPLRTADKLAEPEPWQAPALPASLIEALPAAVLAIDREDHCRLINAAAEDLLQAGRRTLLGRRLSEVLPPDSPLFSLIEQCRLTRSAVTDAEMSIETPRLRLDHVAVEVAPLGEPEGAVVVAMRDRSLERRMARQGAASEAAQSVRSLAGMLAHEIKNPLAGIRGAAQLLESKLGPADAPLAALIREEADRIVGLVNGVEIFADDRPPVMSALNVHEALDHVCRLARASFARHVSLQEAYDPSLPPLRGNRDLLIQVFLNLVKNAAEACDDGSGEIVVTTAYQAGLRIGERNKAHRQPRRIAVTVADNGPGVPEALLGTLFDPFVTGKPGGRGLGLPLVAKLVRAHEGLIEFSSRPGTTRFTVLLPISEDAAAEGEP